tara:strand:- start:125 stop:403 length:279 start_codon:yes stop_codon:yes gene_type:complete
MARPRLPEPRLDNVKSVEELSREVEAHLRDLNRALDQYFAEEDQPDAVGYSADNVTKTRSFDADSTTTAEIADVLGTLIDDFTQAGRLKNQS